MAAKVSLKAHKNCQRAAKALKLPLSVVKDAAMSAGYR